MASESSSRDCDATPRTDALIGSKPGIWRDWKDTDFQSLEAHARWLERELNAVLSERPRIKIDGHYFGGSDRATLILTDHDAGKTYTLDELNAALSAERPDGGGNG